ncbi:MAG: hypothetical protein FE78DRAFT_475800 [Acidomyces sp. 'richmondensis']|nr:MAG: hypothetical protein FE78DRAFT_475800 [Acidomyces sp. 'richmondensis']
MHVLSGLKFQRTYERYARPLPLPPVALLILSVASYSPSITSANLCVNSTLELRTTFGVCKLCKAVWKRFYSKKAPARIFFDSRRSCGANNFSKRLAV